MTGFRWVVVIRGPKGVREIPLDDGEIASNELREVKPVAK